MADGGTNRFYDLGFRQSSKVKAIVGDINTLRPDVRKYYEKKGIKVEQDNDPVKDDFEKAIRYAVGQGWKTIFCFGAFGGRLDHTLANISNTEKLSREFPGTHIVLLGRANILYHLTGPNHYIITLANDINR